jgi:hypothetical protein
VEFGSKAFAGCSELKKVEGLDRVVKVGSRLWESRTDEQLGPAAWGLTGSALPPSCSPEQGAALTRLARFQFAALASADVSVAAVRARFERMPARPTSAELVTALRSIAGSRRNPQFVAAVLHTTLRSALGPLRNWANEALEQIDSETENAEAGSAMDGFRRAWRQVRGLQVHALDAAPAAADPRLVQLLDAVSSKDLELVKRLAGGAALEGFKVDQAYLQPTVLRRPTTCTLLEVAVAVEATPIL